MIRNGNERREPDSRGLVAGTIRGTVLGMVPGTRPGMTRGTEGYPTFCARRMNSSRINGGITVSAIRRKSLLYEMIFAWYVII